jgi:glycogen debranching enzyme
VIDQGMLPNRFPDGGESPEYNTVDATPWFFEANRAYVEYSGDLPFATETLYSKLIDVLEWHLRGTRHGIGCDSDGLLRCGVSGSQLTWMDAKIGDWVVTPRHGKPVEVQALWYNALRIMQQFASTRNDTSREFFLSHLADHARKSFTRLFWNQAAGCLLDCVDGDLRDTAIRPNQIFAVCLRDPSIEGEQARRGVGAVREQLLTPCGLRSLAPSDPHYRARYEGGVHERDSAYHQGTVWPWLMGPFITAFVRVNGNSRSSREQAAEWLSSMEQHLDAACIGQIAEISDGDAPRNPRGCVAQAWSIARSCERRWKTYTATILPCISPRLLERNKGPAASDLLSGDRYETTVRRPSSRTSATGNLIQR